MIRTSPRISLAKLSEYLVAPPLRRQRILEHQVRPREFVVARYRRARRPIVRALSRRSGLKEGLTAAVHRLGRRVPRSAWDENDLENSIAALEAVLAHHNEMDLGDRCFRPKQNEAMGLSIEGVFVSVRPDLIIWSGDPDNLIIAGLKLYFGKTYPLCEASGAYASTVLRLYLETRLQHRGRMIDPALCQVMDVLNTTVHAAPQAYKRRMTQVEAACREIRFLWDLYQGPPHTPRPRDTDFGQPQPPIM